MSILNAPLLSNIFSSFLFFLNQLLYRFDIFGATKLKKRRRDVSVVNVNVFFLSISAYLFVIQCI